MRRQADEGSGYYVSRTEYEEGGSGYLRQIKGTKEIKELQQVDTLDVMTCLSLASLSNLRPGQTGRDFLEKHAAGRR